MLQLCFSLIPQGAIPVKELSWNNVQLFLLQLPSSFVEVVSPYMQ